MNWMPSLAICYFLICFVSAGVAILCLKAMFDGMASKMDGECDERIEKLHSGKVTREFMDSTNEYIDEYLRRCGYDK